MGFHDVDTYGNRKYLYPKYPGILDDLNMLYEQYAGLLKYDNNHHLLPKDQQPTMSQQRLYDFVAMIDAMREKYRTLMAFDELRIKDEVLTEQKETITKRLNDLQTPYQTATVLAAQYREDYLKYINGGPDGNPPPHPVNSKEAQTLRNKMLEQAEHKKRLDGEYSFWRSAKEGIEKQITDNQQVIDSGLGLYMSAEEDTPIAARTGDPLKDRGLKSLWGDLQAEMKQLINRELQVEPNQLGKKGMLEKWTLRQNLESLISNLEAMEEKHIFHNAKEEMQRFKRSHERMKESGKVLAENIDLPENFETLKVHLNEARVRHQQIKQEAINAYIEARQKELSDRIDAKGYDPKKLSEKNYQEMLTVIGENERDLIFDSLVEDKNLAYTITGKMLENQRRARREDEEGYDPEEDLRKLDEEARTMTGHNSYDSYLNKKKQNIWDTNKKKADSFYQVDLPKAKEEIEVFRALKQGTDDNLELARYYTNEAEKVYEKENKKLLKLEGDLYTLKQELKTQEIKVTVAEVFDKEMKQKKALDKMMVKHAQQKADLAVTSMQKLFGLAEQQKDSNMEMLETVRETDAFLKQVQTPVKDDTGFIATLFGNTAATKLGQAVQQRGDNYLDALHKQSKLQLCENDFNLALRNLSQLAGEVHAKEEVEAKEDAHDYIGQIGMELMASKESDFNFFRSMKTGSLRDNNYEKLLDVLTRYYNRGKADYEENKKLIDEDKYSYRDRLAKIKDPEDRLYFYAYETIEKLKAGYLNALEPDESKHEALKERLGEGWDEPAKLLGNLQGSAAGYTDRLQKYRQQARDLDTWAADEAYIKTNHDAFLKNFDPDQKKIQKLKKDEELLRALHNKAEQKQAVAKMNLARNTSDIKLTEVLMKAMDEAGKAKAAWEKANKQLEDAKAEYRKWDAIGINLQAASNRIEQFKKDPELTSLHNQKLTGALLMPLYEHIDSDYAKNYAAKANLVNAEQQITDLTNKTLPNKPIELLNKQEAEAKHYSTQVDRIESQNVIVQRKTAQEIRETILNKKEEIEKQKKKVKKAEEKVEYCKDVEKDIIDQIKEYDGMIDSMDQVIKHREMSVRAPDNEHSGDYNNYMFWQAQQRVIFNYKNHEKSTLKFETQMRMVSRFRNTEARAAKQSQAHMEQELKDLHLTHEVTKDNNGNVTKVSRTVGEETLADLMATLRKQSNRLLDNSRYNGTKFFSKNSNEYTNMLQSLEDMNGLCAGLVKDDTGKYSPTAIPPIKAFKAMLDQIKLSANTYITERRKMDRWIFIPSTMRLTRLAYADQLVRFAETAKKQIESAEKEVKAVNDFWNDNIKNADMDIDNISKGKFVDTTKLYNTFVGTRVAALKKNDYNITATLPDDVKEAEKNARKREEDEKVRKLQQEKEANEKAEKEQEEKLKQRQEEMERRNSQPIAQFAESKARRVLEERGYKKLSGQLDDLALDDLMNVLMGRVAPPTVNPTLSTELDALHKKMRSLHEVGKKEKAEKAEKAAQVKVEDKKEVKQEVKKDVKKGVPVKDDKSAKPVKKPRVLGK